MSRLSESTEALVVEMYLGNYPVEEIMEAASVCWQTVYNVLSRHNIQPHGDSRLPYDPEPYVLPSIDPIWAAEFRGFFWGDGCAGIDRRRYQSKKGPYYIYYPKLRVQLRDDDTPFLEEVCAVLGGGLYWRDRSISRPTTAWQIGGYAQVRTVLEDVLLGGSLPAKKRVDIEVLYEAVLARYDMPRKFDDESRAVIAEYYALLQSVKRYKGSGG